jgi:hypothetical protein
LGRAIALEEEERQQIRRQQGSDSWDGESDFTMGMGQCLSRASWRSSGKFLEVKCFAITDVVGLASYGDNFVKFRLHLLLPELHWIPCSRLGPVAVSIYGSRRPEMCLSSGMMLYWKRASQPYLLIKVFDLEATASPTDAG